MSQSVVVQGSLKHPIKSHNFNLVKIDIDKQGLLF